MSIAVLGTSEVEILRQNLAETTDFCIFPLLAETILWGKHVYSFFFLAYLRLTNASPSNFHGAYSNIYLHLSVIVLLLTSTATIHAVHARIRGLRTRPKQAMLAVTLVMYVLSTLDWAIDVRRVWTDLKCSLPAQISSPARDESGLDRLNTALRIVQSITNNICVRLVWLTLRILCKPMSRQDGLNPGHGVVGRSQRRGRVLESVHHLR
jgi:hypothetical protein